MKLGKFIMFFIWLFAIMPMAAFGDSLLFYEPFEDQSSIQNNGGLPGDNGWLTFSVGMFGKSGNFIDNKMAG